MDKIDIKDEPLQDELVSELYNKAFSQFFFHEKNTVFA